ncbi:hypothetical protein QBC46DRAFT_411179 [Diplogelasinospora grovesii]|uniref:BZIP domain-containing protein n=1 Tax=Diplogelasinospora grovesii TaxID=303347 RepID=A0AAN6N1G3_9PEZI|nr:hypothetical protein QBC46DRAFT_411179 [Diplogelasinospora grovesii]
MRRSPSAEPTKPNSTKRKGTRSVSTLTPVQLARKRANDREAQRAIRARTKEHIERLEREVQELRSAPNRQQPIDRAQQGEYQLLLRKNRELERQLKYYKTTFERLGLPLAPGGHGPYNPAVYCPPPNPAAVYDALDSVRGSGVSSRASSSFGAHATTPAEFSPAPASFAAGSPYQHLPTPEPCESAWALPPVCTSVPASSVASSPCSSTGRPDDFVPGYTPTSVPAPSMMDGGASGAIPLPQGPPLQISCMDDTGTKLEYAAAEDTDSGKAYYHLPNHTLLASETRVDNNMDMDNLGLRLWQSTDHAASYSHASHGPTSVPHSAAAAAPTSLPYHLHAQYMYAPPTTAAYYSQPRAI